MKKTISLPEEYWKENYKEPELIDGICNAKDHTLYLKHFFEIEGIEIKSIIDLGFGLGYLFKEMLKVFKPKKGLGIEPSDYAFQNNVLKGKETLKLIQKDLASFCHEELLKTPKKYKFDLGICTSVFQYLSEEELNFCLPLLSKSVKYLYFSVPVDEEYKRQVSELDFHDRFAKSRNKNFYLKVLAPHFTIVSSRVLESKHYFNEKNTDLTDLLFRF